MQKITTRKNQHVHIGDSFKSDIDTLFRKELKESSVLLVTGKKSFSESNYFDTFSEFIEDQNIQILEWHKFGPNPTLSNISQMQDYNECDTIIAVGGGSVIDYAKKIKLDYYSKVDLVCIYTRYGSGSIVTPFAVYDNNEFKVGEYSEKILPSKAYCSIEMSNQLSTRQKIVGVSDILAHATESLVSTNGNQDSDKKAIEVLSMIDDDVMNFSDKKLFYMDIQAALAESVSMVLVPHAIGHYFTYKYDVPHGIASILTLKEYLSHIDEDNLHKKLPKDKILRLVSELLETYSAETQFRPPSLEEEEVEECYHLTKKYMNFCLENSPEKVNYELFKRVASKNKQ